MNPLQTLQNYGQSVWLDYIRRSLITSGELQRLVGDMVPAAIMGVDVRKFLDYAEEMVHSCAATVPAKDNPGVVLGTILGVLAKQGRDKVTLITSRPLSHLGAWLEQLLAESTGKDGKGLCDDVVDLPVPGQKYSFGVVKAAQARGDFQVLAEHNRRALGLHLSSDVFAGLATLQTAIQQVLI